MNLKADQRRYKVFLDDSYAAEKEDGKSSNIWRYYECRGRHGTVYPYSESQLAVLVTSGRISAETQRTKNWPIIQNGDDETVFLIDSKGFEDGVQVVQAKKRRIATPESIRRLAQWHFKPLNSPGPRETPK